MVRKLILFAAVGVVAACGSAATDVGNPDSGNGRTGPDQFNLTISTSGNGMVRGAGADCRGSCTAQGPSGQQFHLVAVPDPGATFTGWSGACSGAGGCDLTLDADRQVTAIFGAAAPPPQGKNRLTVVVQGKGRVTSSPAGVDCDSTCNSDFPTGTAVTLTASPGGGYNFDGWGTGCSGAGGCTVTLSRDATVYANFVAQQPPPPPPPPPPPAQVHLIASVKGPGTVTGGGLNCGESTSTCDVTVANGSKVTLTAAPAGGTRFAGWGGACSGTATTCDLTVQGETKVSAEFRSEVLVLAPNDGTNNWPIAINSTRLLWQRWVSGSSEIWSVSKLDGADAKRVSNGRLTAVVADDSYLYWTEGDNLYSTPVDGGQVALLYSGSSIGRLALDEDGALYFTVTSGANNGTVHRMQGRADTVLAKGQNPNGNVAVDSTHVYFTNYGSDGGSIRRVPRGGGTVEQILYCGNGCVPQGIRLDSQFLYYRLSYYIRSAGNGWVQAMSKSDFKTVTLNRDQDGSNGYYYPAMEVEVNNSVVYWNWIDGNGLAGVYGANADGSGRATLESSNNASYYTLRVDDVAAYYWHAGAIIRRLK